MVELEPQDRGPEDAALSQVVADPRLNRPEVLTHDDGVGAHRFEREDADQRLVVVAHVGTLGRPGATRDPPQTEQPDHVVDTESARTAQRRLDHPTERLVRRLGEPVGPPRRLRPVLAVLVVGVGWRADVDARGVGLLQHPGVGALRVHSHGQVGHHAQPHAGPAQAELGVRQLLVDHPLQPLLEVDLVGVGPTERLDSRQFRVPQLRRPRRPVRAVHLGDRRPRRVVSRGRCPRGSRRRRTRTDGPSFARCRRSRGAPRAWPPRRRHGPPARCWRPRPHRGARRPGPCRPATRSAYSGIRSGRMYSGLT